MAGTIAIPRTFRLLLAGLASMGALLTTQAAFAVEFLGGPSVRVNPNTSVEFTWMTDVAWFGRIDIFASPNATVPVFTQWSVDQLANKVFASEHIVTIPDAGPITQNTTFYFRVTAVDPGDTTSTLSGPKAAPWTPFFTGTQTLSNAQATSLTTTGATIAWSGNVIGFGKVVFGTSSQTIEDAFNITDHAIDLTGLAPGTTYQFTASNVHAIEADVLASQTGQFTTASLPTTMVLTAPGAEPRVIGLGQLSTVRVRAQTQGGNPVSAVTVGFVLNSSSAGGGVLSAAATNTDSNGIASVQFTASRRGLVQINVFPPAPGINSLTIPIVVR